MKLSGGCQCGRVRYVAQLDPTEAYLCHCRMCQRATGGFAATLVNVLLDRIEWSGEPDWYPSSPIAERPFCSACGTPLGFRYVQNTGKMDLTVGSFDDTSAFRPRDHFGTESLIHESWLDTSGLPRTRSDEYPTLVQKWADAKSSPPD